MQIEVNKSCLQNTIIIMCILKILYKMKFHYPSHNVYVAIHCIIIVFNSCTNKGN